jgi:hypothetical protein
MLCEKVLPLLSEYFDEVLDADSAVQVSQHLDQCIRCRREFRSLSDLHGRLRSLGGVQAPEHLRHLVQYRLANRHRHAWRADLLNALERRWSIIRTTEGMWYWTRVLGTVMASVFFFLISSAISPFLGEASAPVTGRDEFTPAFMQELSPNVLSRLGMLPPPKIRVTKSDAAIDAQCLSNVGQSISQTGNDYDFSVVTYVDRSGMAKSQNVLEHPNDQNFLDNFNKVISGTRFAPARKNGETVPSHIILMFSKMSVYNN